MNLFELQEGKFYEHNGNIFRINGSEIEFYLHGDWLKAHASEYIYLVYYNFKEIDNPQYKKVSFREAIKLMKDDKNVYVYLTNKDEYRKITFNHKHQDFFISRGITGHWYNADIEDIVDYEFYIKE